MTIAAGFYVSDGVLLCADTQLTIPGYLKYPESKIRVWTGQGEVAFFAFAGDADFSTMAINHFTSILQKTTKDGGRREAIESECRILYETYASLPPQDSFVLQMLLALQTKHSVQLSKISGPSFTKVTEFECIGSGAYLARAIASELYSPRMSLKEATPMAAYILGMAKRHVDGCGGNSQILLIFNRTSSYEIITNLEVEVMEKAYTEFWRASRGLLLRYPDISVTQEDFKKMTEAHALRLEQNRRHLIRHWQNSSNEMLERDAEAHERGDVDDIEPSTMDPKDEA
jgi:20S proteasome alpha/beta subunit